MARTPGSTKPFLGQHGFVLEFGHIAIELGLGEFIEKQVLLDLPLSCRLPCAAGSRRSVRAARHSCRRSIPPRQTSCSKGVGVVMEWIVPRMACAAVATGEPPRKRKISALRWATAFCSVSCAHCTSWITSCAGGSPINAL